MYDNGIVGKQTICISTRYGIKRILRVCSSNRNGHFLASRIAAVLVEGVIFMIISIPQIGWRTKMINAIPKDLKIATGAGIGMFLAIIGLREMGWIQDDGATLVNLATTESFGYDHGAVIGLLALVAIMMAKGIKGAIIYGNCIIIRMGCWSL